MFRHFQLRLSEYFWDFRRYYCPIHGQFIRGVFSVLITLVVVSELTYSKLKTFHEEMCKQILYVGLWLWRAEVSISSGTIEQNLEEIVKLPILFAVKTYGEK